MSHELVLTSVSQGLDKAAGFCAVAEDAGLPSFLRERLAPLSKYQHPANEPDGSEQGGTAALSSPPYSPIVYAYRTFSERDTVWYVLTRTAPTGTDYRHLPNHLTHHILFNEDELVLEGPAWLCALPNFHLTQWLTPSVRFPRGRSIPTLTSPQALTRRQWIARQRRYVDPQQLNFFDIPFTPDEITAAAKATEEQATLSKPPTSPCPAWRAATGDAGWGGILADSIRNRQPAVVLFRQGQNLLPLFVEASALLSPELRWAATFCTYTQSEFPPDVDCQWLGVLADSPLANRLRRDRHRLVIDLTAPLGEVPYGLYVAFARSGADRDLPDDEDRTKPIENVEETQTAQDAKTVFQEEPAEQPEPVAVPVPPPLPPILPSEKFTIQTRSSAKKSGLFHSVLNMKGRGQFYFLYGITLLLVLLLLFLVIDQAGRFGIAQRILNGKTAPVAAQPQQPPVKAPVKAPAPKQDPKQDEPLPPEVKPEEVKPVEPVVAVKEDEPPKSNVRQPDVPLPTEEDKEKLTAFLQQNLPLALPMPVPPVNEQGQLSPPKEISFAELAGLAEHFAALDLQFVPLADIPAVKVITKKTADAQHPKSFTVFAVDEKTQHETPMFRFSLSEEGLAVEWIPEGLENQHLYDTVLLSLGFLQLKVADQPADTARIIPMFKPIEQLLEAKASSLLPAPLELPFGKEPWSSVFKEKAGLCSLKLEAEMVHDAADGIKKIETVPDTEPTRCVFRLETDVDYPVEKENGSKTYVPIVLEIEGTADWDKVVWKDRYDDQMKEWKDEGETAKSKLSDMKRQLNDSQNRMMNINTNTKEAREERNRLDKEIKDMKQEIKQLENSSKEIAKKLEKAPEAHKKITENKNIRIKYSVSLVSADGERTLPVAEIK